MQLDQLIFVINASGTLSIGAICFFIVYTTFRGVEDEKILEFSRRFMMAIAILILYSAYLLFNRSVLEQFSWTSYITYLLLVMIFIYMIYAVLAFEKVANKYGIPTGDKLTKMKREEGSN